MDTELIGWRTKENEVSPHYYREDDSDPGADAISLCESFYAFKKDLVFPGPRMVFCGECGEIASKIERGPSLFSLSETDGKLGLGILRHQDFYQAALKALEDGIQRDEADMKEHSCYLIALTNAALALYLLLSEKSKE